MSRFTHLLARHFRQWRREDGQTLVEYGMIVMLLAIAVFGILTLVGQDVVGLFTSVSSEFRNIATP